MKTKRMLFKMAILVMVFTLSACSEKQNDEDLANSDNTEAKSLNGSTAVQVLSLTETDSLGLIFMREEEKLARDAYLVLFSKYNHQVFDNISQSEQVHTDAILRLLNYYNLDDPFIDVIGEFNDPSLAELFNDLMILGDINLDSALVVGALIEETDIEDIANLASKTEVQNIIQVYGNLISGSENHLRAFVKDLSNRGIDYQPRILPADQFNDIINNQN
ncbi:DUF2202 domain-containing protein [Draconibacterium sp. IB214405]|uniref:DUF2202 domain-containing protein n=1 Tax=Draconibacterium sp. IB214405 TaxID=3097352 RepID=UPI002A17D524|nr:DUF2202 domain-containing protein [Draconibacterium sp. IB214405]MDX8339364.1 DUF2202 domain-containing protein [Draconibacterium sp. IB214405]